MARPMCQGKSLIFPVKTKRSRLLSILLYEFFSKSDNNTVLSETVYFAHPIICALMPARMPARVTARTAVRHGGPWALWEIQTSQEPIRAHAKYLCHIIKVYLFNREISDASNHMQHFMYLSQILIFQTYTSYNSSAPAQAVLIGRFSSQNH